MTDCRIHTAADNHRSFITQTAATTTGGSVAHPRHGVDISHTHGPLQPGADTIPTPHTPEDAEEDRSFITDTTTEGGVAHPRHTGNTSHTRRPLQPGADTIPTPHTPEDAEEDR